MYVVYVTEPATRDVRTAYQWWADHRSAEQAGRWFNGIGDFITDLATTADRFAGAAETELREAGVKQAPFGIGRRSTHRVLFRMDGHQVIVLRVRAFKQDGISVDELAKFI